NSSILCPDFMAATSQRGRFPRPDQVSDVWGSRYFGSTGGYLRRGRASMGRTSPWPKAPGPLLRRASRFSSSCFSALIRVDKIALIFSWRDQRSSSDIDSNSNFFIDMWPNPNLIDELTYHLLSFNQAVCLFLQH